MSIKDIARKAIHLTGINFLARQIYKNYPRIIMFHKIYPSTEKKFGNMTTDDFQKYLEYIKRYFVPITMKDLVNLKTEKGVYPQNSVVITFDDGFQSFYNFAWPLLKSLNIPATVFVVPDLIEHKSWIWPDQISYIYDHSAQSFPGKNKNQVIAELKKLSNEDRQKFIDDILKISNISLPKEIPIEFQLMSWDTLKILSNSKLVEIGSHTLTHPILSTENNTISWNEIYNSRCILETKLGCPIQSFCYPNGQVGDYSLEQINMVRRAGYSCAVASHFGYVSLHSNIMALPRIGGDHPDVYSFYKYIDGIEHALRERCHKDCELCLQHNFDLRINKEYCIQKHCLMKKN